MGATPGTLYIAADHAGFQHKETIRRYLKDRHLTVIDLGPRSDERVDYPDYAHQLAEKVIAGRAGHDDVKGILICGTGNGMAMAANRHPTIRAALATSEFMAEQAAAHNRANVLVLGARLNTTEECIRFVDTWLSTPFEGGRHEKRIAKI